VRYRIPRWLVVTALVGSPVLCAARDGAADRSCELQLDSRPAFFEATFELNAGEHASRALTLPPAAEVIVFVQKEGLDVSLRALERGGIVAQSETPLSRQGIERVILPELGSQEVSLEVANGDEGGARGRIQMRALALSAAEAKDPCLALHRTLTAAETAYAKSQSIALGRSTDLKASASASYRLAADDYRAAVQALVDSGPSLLLAQTEHALSVVLYHGLQQWSEAETWANTAAKTYAAVDDRYGEAAARFLQAAALMEIAVTPPVQRGSEQSSQRWTSETLAHARDLLRSLIQFHAARGETYEQGLAQNNLGLAYYYEGLNQEAIRSLEIASKLFKQIHEPRWEKIARQNIALADYELGRASDAVSQYSELLALMTPRDDPLMLSSILNNSALANWLSGNLDQALQQYTQALDLERRMQSTREQARSLHGIGSVYEKLGDQDMALTFYRQVLALLTADLDARARAAALRSAANILRDSGHADEAFPMHVEAVSLASTAATRAQIRVQIARDLALLGRPDEALRNLDQVINEKIPGGEVVRARAQLERGKLLMSGADWPRADADLRAAVQTFEANDSPPDAFAAWVALARLQRKRGNSAAALVAVDHALALAEEVRLQSSNPELRASLLQPLRPAFDMKVSLLAERHFHAAADAREAGRSAMSALQTAEQARARALADYRRVDISLAGVPVGLAEQRNTLAHDLAAHHYQLETLRDRFGGDDARVRAIRVDIAELRARLDETEAQIATHSSAYRRKGSTTRAISAPELAQIPDDVAIIEYWLGADEAFAWVLTRDDLTLMRLGASSAISQTANELHAALRSFGSVPRAARLRASGQLYALVIRPLIAQIEHKQTLIFVPDGALHYIPFATLKPAGEAQSTFLVEGHDIAEAPSIDLLLHKGPKDAESVMSPSRALVVADPVYGPDDVRLAKSVREAAATASPVLLLRGSSDGAPLRRLEGTAKEAEIIASLMQSEQPIRLEGFAATKERFLTSGLDRYRLIHVGSHAVTDGEIPQLSALILSSVDPSGRRIDDRVLAADLMGVRLTADLVVLSACDTALGKSVQGEGLMGLRYVVLARGAKSVVASLWEVSDRAAAQLMTAFYQSFLGAHTSEIRALSSAMRQQLSQPYSDPAEWGAFTATMSRLDRSVRH
jgi:CHAT domain-containing protein